MTKRTCIVTGASRGIGLATARRFAAAGDNVVICARTAASLEKAAEQVREAGGACEPLPADLSDPAEAGRLIEAAVQRFGRVDVLVNNAGAAPLKPIEQFTEEDFRTTHAINIDAVFHACRAVWPVMKKQRSGVIVSVSSISAYDPLKGFAVYGASKAWVNMFMKGLALEGKEHGIRVHTVAPGAVDTQMLRAAFPKFPSDQALQPDEVAGMIELLCDPRSAPATGEAILVRR